MYLLAVQMTMKCCGVKCYTPLKKTVRKPKPDTINACFDKLNKLVAIRTQKDVFLTSAAETCALQTAWFASETQQVL